MANHCFKLCNLTTADMRYAKNELKYFIERGVRVTFLNTVAYVHLDETKQYTVIANLLSFFYHRDKLCATTENLMWIKQWHWIF